MGIEYIYIFFSCKYSIHSRFKNYLSFRIRSNIRLFLISSSLSLKRKILNCCTNKLITVK